MQTVLVVILVALISALALALIAYLLRPHRKDDAMHRAVGDAPRFVRGGYQAMPGDGVPLKPPTTGSGVKRPS